MTNPDTMKTTMRTLNSGKNKKEDEPDTGLFFVDLECLSG